MRQYFFWILFSIAIVLLATPVYAQFVVWTPYTGGLFYTTLSTGFLPPSTTESPSTTDDPIAECDETQIDGCLEWGAESQRKVGNVNYWNCYIPGYPNSIVSCSYTEGECGDKKFTCNEGTVTNRDAGNNPKDTNTHTWECETDNESVDCSIEIEWCWDIELEPWEECCAWKVLSDTEICCKESDFWAGAAGALVGEDEIICDSNRNEQCFQRRLCADWNLNEVHGEKGDPDGPGDFASCNHELVCATAIVHSCDPDRPNNNCQDECLLNTERPMWCNTIINGTCLGLNMMWCFMWTEEAIIWFPLNNLCIGSPADPSTDPDTPAGGIAICGIEPKDGRCGAEPNNCLAWTSLDRPDTDKQLLWICEWVNKQMGWSDAYCSKNRPINGICEWMNVWEQWGCFQGDFLDIADTVNYFYWQCSGKYGWTDAQCLAEKNKDGECWADIYQCARWLFANPFQDVDSFSWDCLGVWIGSFDASCQYTCDAGQVALDDGTCGTDLCSNLDGDQLELPIWLTRNASGECLCANGALDPDLCETCGDGYIMIDNACECEDYPDCKVKCGSNSRVYAPEEVAYGGEFCQSPLVFNDKIPPFPARWTHIEWMCGDQVCRAYRENCVPPQVWNGTYCGDPGELPACGDAAREYISPENTYSGTFCNPGQLKWGIPSFPTPGNSVSWECI